MARIIPTLACRMLSYPERQSKDEAWRASGYQPDITVAKDLPKWSPKVKREEGLQRTIRYFRKKLGVG